MSPWLGVVVGCAVAWSSPDPDSDHDSDHDDEGPAALVGVFGPGAGKVVLSLGGGMAFILPHLTMGMRVGITRRGWVGLRYRTVSGLSHAGRLHGGWGARVAPRLWLGGTARTTLSTLQVVDGVMGIRFSQLSLGNDWELGGDIELTLLRPERAHVTFGLGATGTLGGVRYTGYDQRSFSIDPGPRAVNASVRGEWVRSDRRNLTAGFEAVVLIAGDLVPLGFLPIASIGGSWWL